MATIVGLNQINKNILQVANTSVPLLVNGAKASKSLLGAQIEISELYNSTKLSSANQYKVAFNELKSDLLETISKLNTLIISNEGIRLQLQISEKDIESFLDSAGMLINNKNQSLLKKLETAELATEFSDMGDEVLSFAYDLEGIIKDDDNNKNILLNITENLENTIEIISDGTLSDNIFQVKNTISIVNSNVSSINTKINELSAFENLLENPQIIAMKAAFSRFKSSSTGNNSALAKHTQYLTLKNLTKETALNLKNNSRQAVESLTIFNEKIEKYTNSIKLQAKSSVKNTSNISILMGVIVTIISIAVSFYVTRSITLPLFEAVKNIKKVSTGDLTVQFSNIRQDELGILNRNMQTLVTNFRDTISNISASSHTLASTAEQTTTISSQSYDSVMKQKQQTEIISLSLTEMVDSVSSVATSIYSTLEAVEEAHNQAVNGEKLLNNNIQRIQSLSTSIEGAADVIGLLNQETNNISSVLEVIRSVAEQTNLLALNAAIEAARAGEQGRGFAVVADEVRTLASRSHDSTAEIQQLIERLLDGADKAVKAMDTSRKETNECVEGIESLGTMLATINTSIISIKDMSQQISNAAEQQSSTAKTQAVNISHISSLSELTSNSAEENRHASEELAKMAENQRKLVSKFIL